MIDLGSFVIGCVLGFVIGFGLASISVRVSPSQMKERESNKPTIEDVGFGHIPQDVKAKVAKTPDKHPREERL